MASVLSTSSMILPSLAVSQSSLDNILFDPVFYASNNLDVVQALGSTDSALKAHYDTYGKREGRAPSDMFDPHFYLESYPDLKAAFGQNYVAAYNHFVQHGISEGRAGSASFHVEVYKNNYSDLRNAFGTASSDNCEYLRHWDDYGRKEGRTATGTLTSSATTSAPSSPTTPTQTQTVTKYVKTSSPGNFLNLRSGPSTSYSVLKKLSYGTAVQVLSISDSWAKVHAAGSEGYVSTQYLSDSDPNAANPTPYPATANSSTGYATYTGVNYRNLTSNSRRIAACDKAVQMAMVLWTSPCEFPTWKSSGGAYNSVTATDGTTSKQFLSGKTYQGIPYSMAGRTYDDTKWLSLVKKGLTNQQMTGKYYTANADTTAKGIDCSYLVCVALNAGCGTSLDLNTTKMLKSSNFQKISRSQMLPGDIFLKSRHVMFFIGKTADGRYAVIEANADYSRVVYRELSVSSISSYGCYRYSGF